MNTSTFGLEYNYISFKYKMFSPYTHFFHFNLDFLREQSNLLLWKLLKCLHYMLLCFQSTMKCLLNRIFTQNIFILSTCFQFCLGKIKQTFISIAIVGLLKYFSTLNNKNTHKLQIKQHRFTICFKTRGTNSWFLLQEF